MKKQIIIPEAECSICKKGILLPFSEFLGHNMFTSATAPVNHYNCNNCGVKFKDGAYYKLEEVKKPLEKIFPWSKQEYYTTHEWMPVK